MEASCDSQPYALNSTRSGSVVFGGLILRLRADAYTPYTLFGLQRIVEDSRPHSLGQYFTAFGLRPSARSAYGQYAFLNRMAIHYSLTGRQGFSRTFLQTLAMTGVGLLLMFAAHIVLARLMGAEGYGQYAYVLTWVAVLVLAAKLGFETALQRFVPEYLLTSDWAGCLGVLRGSFQIVGATSLILAIGLAVGAWVFAPSNQTALIHTFMAGTFLVPMLTLLKLLHGGLLAFKRPLLALAPEALVAPLLVMMSAIGLYWFQGRALVQAPGLMLVYAVGLSVLVGLVFWGFFFRIVPAQVWASVPRYHASLWFKMALPMWVIGAMQMVLSYTDTLMVGLFLGTTKAGIYAISSRMAGLVAIPLTMVNLIVAPQISQLYCGGRISDLQKLITHATRRASVLALLGFIGLVSLGNMALQLFGETFVTGADSLRVLAVGQLINVACGSVVFLLSMTGRQVVAAIILVIAAILNLGLNYILIPLYGLVGAAVATAVVVAGWNIAMLFLLQKDLGIRSGALAREL